MGGETPDDSGGSQVTKGPSPRGRGNRASGPRQRLQRRSIPAWAGKPLMDSSWLAGSGVHPRVGGETDGLGASAAFYDGPSPRGRGNQPPDVPGVPDRRSIPAWAGKPRVVSRRMSRSRVHPRVGGETGPADHAGHAAVGPSPRGRGNHRDWSSAVTPSGSIPAWAGKPAGNREPENVRAVHPRVGGETESDGHWRAGIGGPSPRGRGNPPRCPPPRHLIGSIPAWAGKPESPRPGSLSPGVHPRVGGETGDLLNADPAARGPSPRGRGNPRAGRNLLGGRRSIPAWAGKPRPCSRRRWPPRVHPRVGGETAEDPRGGRAQEGPSPRGRGNPPLGTGWALGMRSIPAWAGKPASGLQSVTCLQVHPRVGGETGTGHGRLKLRCGPSPRGRGNRRPFLHAERRHGSIPAWAGKPAAASRRSPPGRVHPRVGGETAFEALLDETAPGPSPRGRGNRAGSPVDAVGERSIPAWAGKPCADPRPCLPEWVHPRVGGETQLTSSVAVTFSGPSPRGRGNRRTGRDG